MAILCRNSQKGFALMAAIFFLVLISTIAGVMVNAAGVQRAHANLSQLSKSADYAARSVLEWALAAGTCVGAPVLVDGYNTVCTTSGVTTYQVDASRVNTNLGDLDFVQRTVRARQNPGVAVVYLP